jgi:hypothetical protein
MRLVVGAKPRLSACLLVALALTACGTGNRERDAEAVVESFHAALQSGDGQAACDELSEEVASKLEQQEGKPCEEAIVSLKIPKGGSVAVRHVEMRNAYMGLAEGSADFLEEGAHGWEIAAAGCQPAAASNQPYECELEG